MIILIVDNLGIAVYKAKSYAPVCLYRNGPDIFSAAFEPMQVKARQPETFNRFSGVKRSKYQSQPIGMLSLNAGSADVKVKPFQPLVSKRTNNCLTVTKKVTPCQSLGNTGFDKKTFIAFSR